MSTVSNCGAKGKRDGRVLVSKGCLLLRGHRIGRGGHRCRRPVKNSTYSHPLFHHFHHHSNPVYPNPGTTDRANQYKFCFGCLLCVVIRIHHHCGNLPPTPMMNGRHATTATIPAQTEKTSSTKSVLFFSFRKIKV